MTRLHIANAALAAALTAATAAQVALASPGSAGELGELKGSVRIDGSSTVYLISEAAAEEFRQVAPRVRVTVAISGTTGGFQRFVRDETDLNDASRPITQSEIELAAAYGVDFIELPVGFDGITVVVSEENDFVDHFTVEELRRIWQPRSPVTTWQDVRADWPAKPIVLYAPGVDSGTFEYFTLAVNGGVRKARGDFIASEDDFMVAQGVSGDPYALGFFGHAYLTIYRERLRAVPIDSGSGPVAPSPETITDASYQPLARPLFLYVNKQSADREEVAAFVRFYLERARMLVSEVGYAPLPEAAYAEAEERFERRHGGSLFGGAGPTLEVTVESLTARGL